MLLPLSLGEVKGGRHNIPPSSVEIALRTDAASWRPPSAGRPEGIGRLHYAHPPWIAGRALPLFGVVRRLTGGRPNLPADPRSEAMARPVSTDWRADYLALDPGGDAGSHSSGSGRRRHAAGARLFGSHSESDSGAEGPPSSPFYRDNLKAHKDDRFPTCGEVATALDPLRCGGGRRFSSGAGMQDSHRLSFVAECPASPQGPAGAGMAAEPVSLVGDRLPLLVVDPRLLDDGRAQRPRRRPHGKGGGHPR